MDTQIQRPFLTNITRQFQKKLLQNFLQNTEVNTFHRSNKTWHVKKSVNSQFPKMAADFYECYKYSVTMRYTLGIVITIENYNNNSTVKSKCTKSAFLFKAC